MSRVAPRRGSRPEKRRAPIEAGAQVFADLGGAGGVRGGLLGLQISGNRAELVASLEPEHRVLRLARRVRRIIYTSNALEALNSKVRRAVRTRSHFLGDNAAMKLPYLVLDHAAQEWERPQRKWTEAETQFAVIFGDRFTI